MPPVLFMVKMKIPKAIEAEFDKFYELDAKFGAALERQRSSWEQTWP
jgi:hypothetical protein